jgi:hypothetical protein
MSSSELQKLTGAVALQIPFVFGDGASLASPTPASLHRRYSFMFRYPVRLPEGTTKSIIVKIPRDFWMQNLEEATRSHHIRGITKTEFETLHSIADAVEASGRTLLCAIRPLAILPEFNAFFLDYIQMRLLKTSLSRFFSFPVNRKEWEQFERQLQLAGTLLHLIHSNFAAMKQTSLESLRALETPTECFDVLGHHQYGSLTDLYRLFIDLYESVKAVPIPLAGLHNDYHLGNIFVTPEGKVGTLDPNWTASGSVYVDLASILTYPQTRKVQVLTHGLRYPSWLHDLYKTAVLRGYFSGSQVSLPILNFYCALAALEKWRYIEELLHNTGRLTPLGSWATACWVRRYFFRLVRNYLEQGLRATISDFSLADREHLAGFSSGS